MTLLLNVYVIGSASLDQPRHREIELPAIKNGCINFKARLDKSGGMAQRAQ